MAMGGVCPGANLIQRLRAPCLGVEAQISLEGEGRVRESDRISAGRAEKGIPRRHSACSRERDLAKREVVR
jgi:hypothetical protein